MPTFMALPMYFWWTDWTCEPDAPVRKRLLPLRRAPMFALPTTRRRVRGGGDLELPDSWRDGVSSFLAYSLFLLELATCLLADEVERLALPLKARCRRELGEGHVSNGVL